MKRLLPAYAAGAIVVAAGVVHGLMTDRWKMSEVRRDMAARVPAVPAHVNGWVGEELPLDGRHLTIAEADSHLARRYRRGDDSKEVTLILLSGRGAVMAVHTPDVCFANVGYRMEGTARPIALTRGDRFWAARFRRDGEPGTFSVLWGWSDGGRWQAPEDARNELGRRKALYKLYVVCPNSGNDDDDAARRLLTDLLPDLHRTLALP